MNKKFKLIKVNPWLKLRGMMYRGVFGAASQSTNVCDDLDGVYNYIKSSIPDIKSGNHTKTDNQYQVRRNYDMVNVREVDKAVLIEKWIPTESKWVICFSIQKIS